MSASTVSDAQYYDCLQWHIVEVMDFNLLCETLVCVQANNFRMYIYIFFIYRVTF